MILAITVLAMIPAVIPVMTAMAMMITSLLSSSNAMACNQVVFGCDTDSMLGMHMVCLIVNPTQCHMVYSAEVILQ